MLRRLLRLAGVVLLPLAGERLGLTRYVRLGHIRLRLTRDVWLRLTWHVLPGLTGHVWLRLTYRRYLSGLHWKSWDKGNRLLWVTGLLRVTRLLWIAWLLRICRLWITGLLRKRRCRVGALARLLWRLLSRRILRLVRLRLARLTRLAPRIIGRGLQWIRRRRLSWCGRRCWNCRIISRLQCGLG